MTACCRCHVEKAPDDFDVDKRNRSGRAGACKQCKRRVTRLGQRARRGVAAGHPPELVADPDARLPTRLAELPDGHTKLSPQGYVLEMRRGHPRASRHGYVFQHILVAEAKYGMPLGREYTVHHRNNSKADNRPANLELRLGQHGPGGDVIDVLLRDPELRLQAVAVLEQYGYRVSAVREADHQSFPVASGL